MKEKKQFHASYGWITPEEFKTLMTAPIDGQAVYLERKYKKRAYQRSYRAKKKGK